MSKISAREVYTISTVGKSVTGVGKAIVDFMESLPEEQKQYPSQWGVLVESQSIKITRNYMKDI